MKRRGGRALPGLGRNSMGSNSVSQWKMCRFFNAVLQTGPCPALAPRTTHTHMCTLAQAPGSTFHPSPPGGGGGGALGMAAFSFQHLQNKSEVGRWLTPSQRHPRLFGNKTPPRVLCSQPQRLGGPQRKETGLQTSPVSVHLHVKQFSHTMRGVVWNIPSSVG